MVEEETEKQEVNVADNTDKINKRIGFAIGILLFIIGVVLFFYFGYKGYYDVGSFLLSFGILVIMVACIAIVVYLYQKRKYFGSVDEAEKLLSETELNQRANELIWKNYCEKLVIEEKGMKQLGSNPLWFVKGHGFTDNDAYAVIIDMQNADKYQILKNAVSKKIIDEALTMLSRNVPLYDTELVNEENPTIGVHRTVERKFVRRGRPPKNKEPLEE